MFGKSQAVIAARRDVKQRFVALALHCAGLGPRALTGRMKLNGEETGNVTLAVMNFSRALVPADRETLRTAKGCTARPSGAQGKDYNTLDQFIQFIHKPIDQVGCMAAYTYDMIKWAEQVMATNPHSFTGVEILQFNKAIAELKKGAISSDADYIANPTKFGEPANADQALYYLALELGRIVDGLVEDITVPEQVQAVKPRAMGLWRAVESRLPQEIRENPNIATLMSNYDRGLKMCMTKYAAFF